MTQFRIAPPRFFLCSARETNPRKETPCYVIDCIETEVGLVLSFDVTRLSRNCSDWYPLLDVCGYKGCLIADRDGVYDPASPNGRLLLGLKGQISDTRRG